jgi:hypothetical protein
MSEWREFWMNPDTQRVFTAAMYARALADHKTNMDYFEMNTIHVVEIAALDEVKAERDELQAIIEESVENNEVMSKMIAKTTTLVNGIIKQRDQALAQAEKIVGAYNLTVWSSWQSTRELDEAISDYEAFIKGSEK